MGALEEALPPGVTRAQAEELLPKLCYRFRNGEWARWHFREDAVSGAGVGLQRALGCRQQGRMQGRRCEGVLAVATWLMVGPLKLGGCEALGGHGRRLG